MTTKEKQVHEHIHHETHMQVRKIGVLFIVSWILGILFIFGGINGLVKGMFSNILIILGGIIILPPFGKFIQEKFNIQLTGWLKFALFLIMVTVGISLETTSGENIGFDIPETTGIQPTESVKVEEETTSLPIKTETGMIATVNSAKKQNIIGDCGEHGWTCDKADFGKLFLIIDVTVENKGTTGFMATYISTSDFKIKDGDDYVYSSTYTSLGQEFPSGEIHDGDKVRGKIAFEIPEDAKRLKLTFKDSSIYLES
ncbi:DUF4352 domain-containing protein [Candidatus Woesearchaeota archaeon]|nr:DUF4352 domain-containing protein [Candidatus Woesearchaeota archaeon]